MDECITSGEKFDLRQVLNSEFRQRQGSNGQYSLRAFARDLGVEPSALSKILTGKRMITLQMRNRFAKKLRVDLNGSDSFLDKSDTYQSLTEDEFKCVADWPHYAMLELTKVKGFRPDLKWIAQHLRISPTEAETVVKRLIRMGYLERRESNLVDISGHLTTVEHPFTNIALRSLQKQILHQSIIAIDQVPLAERDHSSMTMAIDSSKIPEAKKMIQRFRRKLTKFLESSEHRDAVYQLSIGLFPSTPIKKDTKERYAKT